MSRKSPISTGWALAYTPPFFSPFDAFDPSVSWAKVHLTREEIQTLVHNAPAELKTMFHAGQGDDGIEAISLEYSNVVVMRPWHRPELYESRYWKVPDNTIISDGNVPRRGQIPAYITSMIVVRNVTVTRKKAAASKPVDIPILRVPIRVPIKDVAMLVAAPAPPIAAPVTASMVAAPTTLRVATPTTTRMGAPATAVGVEPAIQPVAMPSTNLRYVDAKYAGTTIKTPDLTIPVKADDAAGTTPSPSQTELVTETFQSEGIVVLAYVCKRVPRSPNPDESLGWSS
jgi:hypothetical protein